MGVRAATSWPLRENGAGVTSNRGVVPAMPSRGQRQMRTSRNRTVRNCVKRLRGNASHRVSVALPEGAALPMYLVGGRGGCWLRMSTE